MDVRGRIKSQLDRVRDALPLSHARVSFAQEGEDLILDRIFEHQATGIYVDVGAHHPRRFSNTLLLYRRGWHGVNIDAMPGSMKAFEKLRPRDVNLELGVTAVDGVRDFYVFEEPALNTFDYERVKSLSQHKLLETRMVRCAPLSTILREHGIGAIDLLTIDAEGFDFEVLQTVDWTESAPKVVLIEQHARDIEALLATPVHAYMRQHGYRLAAKTHNSVFYTG